jgi:two-component system response regulator AtoC
MPDQKQHRVLLAVRDKKACSALRGYFRLRGNVAEVGSGIDLESTARASRPCAILLELRSGDSTLERMRRELPDVPVVGIVPPLAEARFEAARWGVTTTLGLPLDEAEMIACLDAAFQSLGCSCHPASAPESTNSSLFDLPGLFNSNSSQRMIAIRDLIDKVATTSAAVLIRGESGVGKEIAARMVFRLSDRRDKPFVKVNCAAIPNDLLESELFGFEAGAFTGAHRSKPGKFELANGGTLFLDEIAEMHPGLQAKLLHVLQDGEFARLGSKRDTSVDVRVICATNRNLETRVAEGLFREDLLYRINVVTVTIPPLRERREEIPGLIQYFLDKYSASYRRTVIPFDSAAREALIQYPWPGNIRELENLCKRYVIVGDATSMMRELQTKSDSPALERRVRSRRKSGKSITVLKMPTPIRPGLSLLEIGRQAARQAELQAIENMLVATRWNRREAARRLQVSYKALLNKMKQMQVQSEHQQ